jgi:hypothetical protein
MWIAGITLWDFEGKWPIEAQVKRVVNGGWQEAGKWKLEN